jgi:hypothetical protein
MDRVRRSRPVPKVGPKNLYGLREFGWRDMGAYRRSVDLMLGNHVVTTCVFSGLHEKQECISAPLACTCS